MSKILLNRNNFRITNEDLARCLEEQGVTCERKRNGNIWVKSNNRSADDFFDVENAVKDIFREHGGRLKYDQIRYDFFDHAGFYTADDGSTVTVFCPYWAQGNWPSLIPYMWEKGYYVSMCGDTVFVRKRKEGDVMFTPAQDDLFRVEREMDWDRYTFPKSEN